MEKEKIIPWVERVSKAPITERNAIVAEMAKQNNLKEREAWKLLRENGFDPKTTPQTDPQKDPQDPSQADPQTDKQDDSKKQSVVLRHKTQYPQYRRAGLVLTQKAQTYNVTEDQLAALEKDPWVVIGKENKEGTDE